METETQMYGGIAARPLVFLRDDGVCKLCGFPGGVADRVVSYLKAHDDYESVLFLVNLWRCPITRIVSLHGTKTHLWESDHVIPVCLGGDVCSLDNYRTLCVPCHRDETKAMRRRVALLPASAVNPPPSVDGKKLKLFRLDDDIRLAMRAVKTTERIPESAQIDLAMREWLEKRGSLPKRRKR